MSQDDFQFWVAVEHPAHDHTHRVQSGFCCESPTGKIEPIVEKWADHGRRWLARVQIQGQVERLGRFQDWPEVRRIEIFAGGVRVYDQSTDARQTCHTF